MKRVPNVKVMSVGEVVDSSGTKRTWTKEQLTAFAQNYKYDTDANAAPVILGHEEDSDRPRFGYVESLRSDDKGLYADLQISEELLSAMKEGLYPNRSVSVSTSKPIFYHLGILGAAQPAFKDLGKIQFSAAGDPDRVSLSLEGDIASAGISDVMDMAWRMLGKLNDIQTAINTVSNNVSNNVSGGAKSEQDESEAALERAKAEIERLQSVLREHEDKEASDFAQAMVDAKKILASHKDIVKADYAKSKSEGKTDELRLRYAALGVLEVPATPKIEPVSAGSPAQFSEAVEVYARENNMSIKEAAITLEKGVK